MRNPPILISVLGFFAMLAGFGYFFFGLRVLGFDWFGIFGDLPKYESAGLWGWLAIGVGIIWILAAIGLWALQPWARRFAMAIMPALILWYLTTAEVKDAFGEADL